MAGEGRDRGQEQRALRLGLWVTGSYCLAEIVGGYLTNSLALLSDAAHMFTDVGALGLTLFSLWTGSRPATESKTFGYYRAEILAALANGMLLWAVVLFILREAWLRMEKPPPVHGPGMLAVAALGLGVNAFIISSLAPHRRRSLGLRGAYMHVFADLLGSVGAVGAGLVMVTTGWYRADAVASAVIALLIVVGSWTLVRDAVDVLMEAVPRHIDIQEVRRALEGVEGTREVHDLHVWSLTSGYYALSAHAVVAAPGRGDQILREMCERLQRAFNIRHVTIQLEEESHHHVEPHP